MWNFFFGWMLGTTAGNSALPDDVKTARYDRRQQRKAHKRAVRAQPTNWWVVAVVSVLLVAVLLLAR